MNIKVFFRVGGGIGNQLFVYFTGKALERKGYKVKFDLKSGFFLDKHSREPILQKLDLNLRKSNWFEIAYFFIAKNLRESKIGSYTKELSPREFTKLNSFKHKYNFVEGYFQSYSYFDKYKNEIIRNLNFNLIDDDEYLKYLNSIISSNSVCIHIRTLQSSENVTIEKKRELLDANFYKEAIKKLSLFQSNNLVFFVFAMNLSWSKKNLPKGYKYVFVEPKIKNDLFDFILMSKCKSFIIPNSTYSWWAAYISDSEIVYYNKQKKPIDVGVKGNYFPKHWVQINS